MRLMLSKFRSLPCPPRRATTWWWCTPTTPWCSTTPTPSGETHGRAWCLTTAPNAAALPSWRAASRQRHVLPPDIAPPTSCARWNRGNHRKLRVTAQPNVTLAWQHLPARCRRARTLLLGPLMPEVSWADG